MTPPLTSTLSTLVEKFPSEANVRDCASGESNRTYALIQRFLRRMQIKA